MSMFVAVVMFVTIGNIKTKCLYRETRVDAASADQYVTFAPPFSFVFVYDIFTLCWWHIIVRVSMEGGTMSSPSVGTSAKCRPCQWGWWHSVVSVSKDGGTVSLANGDNGTVSFLSVGMVAQCRFC
jgi:hypothetical protein